MAKLGSQNNPLILNAHSEHTLQYIAKTCTENNWHYICGMNPQDPEDLNDLNQKLYPHILERTFPKIGRNEPCPCGSCLKYKKCHWLDDQNLPLLEP